MNRINSDTTTQAADVVGGTTLDVPDDARPGSHLAADRQDGPGTPLNAADIRGKAVISITSGARLGRVDEVLFDRGSLGVAAFRVSAAGQQAVIPFDQVERVGSDAVMVPGDDVAQWITTSSAADGLVSIDGLKHLKVVDDAGTFLGTPRAIEVDPRDGRLLHLQVHKGGMLGIGGETLAVPGGDLAGVGDDVIVVRAATARV
jgi:sporulation protein YlmC with PRC-barrel domain